MLDSLLDLSFILCPLLAITPWIISIAWQNRQGREITKRLKVFVGWTLCAIIFAVATYLYDSPHAIRREWDYSGLNFLLFGIVSNFGLLGIGGMISLFIACPTQTD